MADVVKRGRHYLLLLAAGSAAISAAVLGAAIPSVAANPQDRVSHVGVTVFVTVIYLSLAVLLGWAAFRANRAGVIGVSVAAVVVALFVGLFVLDGAFAFGGTVATFFLIAASASALVALFAALELILGRQHPGTSTSKPGVA
jgi:hypothetical protein